MHIKHEITKEILPRYLQANKQEKKKILDEFSATTGYHRKSAIRKLKDLQMTPYHKDSIAGKHSKNRERIYDGYVEEVVMKIYQVLNGIGAKRIHPIINQVLDKGIEFGHLKVDLITEMKVRKISKSTLDRMIVRIKERSVIKGISTTRPGKFLKSEIPLRVGVWEESSPGFTEIDLVAHCGDNAAGLFISTLNTSDIATGWFEAEPVMGKSQERVLVCLKNIHSRLPFKLLGIDSDNGSEFINYQLYGYCKKENIIFTRSRPYKKNDNAHIEQKNYTQVRQVLGYQRFETKEVFEMIKELYTGPLRLYINFFQPSMKCIDKIRTGSKIRKTDDIALTPYGRIMLHTKIPKKTKEMLTHLFNNLDPFALKQEIDVLIKKIQKDSKYHL